jgi:flagellar hook-basal body complex protein FliE
MGFREMVTAPPQTAVGKLHNAESMSLKALQGADLETREVVDAVMSAEQTLQAAVAIRDKIVSAYLEISRMAI